MRVTRVDREMVLNPVVVCLLWKSKHFSDMRKQKINLHHFGSERYVAFRMWRKNDYLLPSSNQNVHNDQYIGLWLQTCKNNLVQIGKC